MRDRPSDEHHGRSIPSVGTAVVGAAARTGRHGKFSRPALRFSPSTFRERRRRLVGLTDDGVAVLFGAKSILDAWDERRFDPTFRLEMFRQESNLFYLTGIELPGAAAALDLASGALEIFLPRIDAQARAELDRLDLGVARPLSEFENRIAGLVRGRMVYLVVRTRDVASLRSGFAEHTSFPSVLPGGSPGTFPDERLAAVIQERFDPAAVTSLVPVLAELRRTKDAEEIAAIRDAVAASIAGIRAGISTVAPGVETCEVSAEMRRAFRRHGALREAFAPVVQSGEDGLLSFVDVVDAYDGLNVTMRSGDLVLLDYGAEMDYYVADLARTVPVSGRFSAEQRIAYDAYVTAYQAGLDALGPRVPFMAAAAATGRALNDLEPVVPEWLRPAISDFARAVVDLRPGHFLGLELHDHEEYYRPLEPGEVIAYEHHFRIPQRGWRITVEDMVLVTDDGRLVLSRDLPRDAEALESLMSRGGAG